MNIFYIGGLILALLGGTALGILIRYFMDKDLVEDAWYEWDSIYKKEREAQKRREKRMVAEITRLHAQSAPQSGQQEQEQEKTTEEWVRVLNDVSEAPEWHDVDFGGF